MQKRPNVLLLISVQLACCTLLAASACAQLVASRDLTSDWRPPSDHISVPQSCDSPRSSIDGEKPPTDSPTQTKDVELRIVSIAPVTLEIGNDFTATVQLKNVGNKPVLLPAVADGEKVLRPSADGTEEKYEVGDITFRLATDEKHGVPIFLSTGGALFANPDDAASYVTLKPGNWLELKLHGAAECGVSQCFGGLQPDKKAVLTAWWYQRVLTHKVNGCEETHGSYNVREVDSVPFTVEVKNPSDKTSSVAWRF